MTPPTLEDVRGGEVVTPLPHKGSEGGGGGDPPLP